MPKIILAVVAIAEEANKPQHAGVEKAVAIRQRVDNRKRVLAAEDPILYRPVATRRYVLGTRSSCIMIEVAERHKFRL